MKKTGFLIIGITVLLILTPILATASGGNSGAAVDSYVAGNSEDMLVFAKNYLGSAKGKEEIEDIYLPYLKEKASQNLHVYFEWVFYPVWFSGQSPKEMLPILDKLLYNEVCDTSQSCKKKLVPLKYYVEKLFLLPEMENLKKIGEDKFTELLEISLEIESVSPEEIWGGWDGEIDGEGVPENYLELRSQYKMGYPFDEKFVLYAPFGFSAIYGDSKHLGADLNKSPNGCCGTRINSVSGGIVTFKGKDSAGANLVIVKVGDVSILYAHMMQPSDLSAGEVINKGDLIGYVGTTGNSTGCHLHLEMRYKDQLINPEVFIDLLNGQSYF